MSTGKLKQQKKEAKKKAKGISNLTQQQETNNDNFHEPVPPKSAYNTLSDNFNENQLYSASTPHLEKHNNEEDELNYKLIVAIKQVKEHSAIKHPNVKCIITIQDKQKNVTLPFTEGQFFGLRQQSYLINRQLYASDVVHIRFSTASSPQQEIGEMSIQLSEENITQKESEIFQEFSFEYEHQGHEFHFNGSFYGIILNKTIFLKETSTPKKQKKEVQFQQQETPESNKEFKGRSAKRQPTGGQPLKRQQPGGVKSQKNQDVDPQILNDQIEQVVKNAKKELLKAHEIEETEPSYEPNRVSLQRAQTIQQVEESTGGRISESVQIMRQSTRGRFMDSSFEQQNSPSKLEKTQTFNIDDGEISSPNRLSTRSKTMKSSSSPTRHSDNYDHHCHENLTCLYYIDQANQSNKMKIENDYLKKVIYALDKRVKALSSADDYNRKFQEDLIENEHDRRRLNDSIQRAQQDNDQLKGHIQNALTQAQREKAALQNQLNQKEQEVEKLQSDNRVLSNELNQQQLKNQDLEKRMDDQSKMLQRMKDLESALTQAEQRADDAESNAQQRANELGDLLDQAHRQRSLADQKHQQALQKQTELQNELDNQRLNNGELKQEIKRLQAEINMFKNKEGNAKMLQDQVHQLQAELQDKVRAKQQSDIMNEQLRKQILQLHAQLAEKDKQFNEKAKELRKQIQDLQHTEQMLNQHNAEKTKQNIALKQDLKVSQLAAGLAQDYLKQLEEEKVRSQHYHKTQQALVQQNQEFSQTIYQMTKQTNTLQLINLQLQEDLEQSDTYAQNLKKLICEMQEKNVIYIPYHSDPIDKALADFINSSYDPDRLNGLFIREGEGIYLFGTKKLYIKIEQDKILIRTGGGFIGIEEFLDVYTPAELEKMKRVGPAAQKAKNQNLAATMDRQGKLVKEIVHPHNSPLKVRSLGPVFSKAREEQ